MRRTKSFAHTPTSVASARHFAGEALQGVLGEVHDTIALMISELASNCIRHTDAGFKLTIIQTAAEIRVEATDRGAGKPRMRTPAPTDPNGRGLQIVDMLASSWGFDALPEGGKTVWFALDTQAPARVQA